MTEPAGRPHRYRFGLFEVDVRTGEIRKAGSRLKLGPQPFRVLQALLERPSEVVTREELQRSLWPADTFVEFEGNLNSAVKRLRAVLGDSADTPRFVETVPRRGYRFLAPVEIISPDPVRDAGSEPPGNGALTADAPATDLPRQPGPQGMIGGRLAIVAAVLGLAVAAFVWMADPLRYSAVPSVAQPASVAVLPFENLSAAEEHAYLADGTTEALIAALAQVRVIKVISRTSVMRFQGTDRPVPEIAREPGVASILEGSVTRFGNEVRVTAQLIDAATERHLWAETFTGRLGELLAFQAQVARSVAREVQASLSPPEAVRLAAIPRVDPAVEEAFLKARYFWNQRTAEGLSQAIEHFSRAAALDPTYAPARAGLADAYNLLPRYGTDPARRALAEAKAHAAAALALDADLAQAHAALAKAQHSLDWDWEGSERSFRRAIELGPSYATAHHWYSVFLLTVGRVAEGVEQARRARELDPLSPVINLHLAWSLYYADELEASAAGVARALELDSRYANAHYLSGWLHLRRGDAGQAGEAFRTAIALSAEPREYLGGLAAAEVAAGRTAAARDVLAELTSTRTTAELSGQPLVWALVALGRTDDAFRILETDFENRSVCFYLFDLVNHWFLEPLRADRRLQALLERSGLPLAEGESTGGETP